MPDETFRQPIVDEEHLKLLSLGYMISAGMAAFVSLFGLLYVAIGIVMSVAASHAPRTAARPNEMPPAFIGWFLGVAGLTVFILMIALAFLKFQTGLNIRHRKSRTFCMVVGAISCLEFPYGTLLGVSTFIVLGRDTVERLFR